VQSDVRTQLIQAVKHQYSIFQSLNVVSNDILPFRTTFQERDCVSGVGVIMFKKVQVAKYTHFRGYYFSFAIKQHYRVKKLIMLCTAVWETHTLNNNDKLVV